MNLEYSIKSTLEKTKTRDQRLLSEPSVFLDGMWKFFKISPFGSGSHLFT
jgi:hypothetical protein